MKAKIITEPGSFYPIEIIFIFESEQDYKNNYHNINYKTWDEQMKLQGIEITNKIKHEKQ